MANAQPAIFLSHTWADKPLVRRLEADLAAAGAHVWLDEAEVKIGDSLIEKIREGIDRVDYLGVVLTSRSVTSEWVKREVDIAMTQEIRGRRVKVLPLVFEKCELPGFLEGKLYADFTEPQGYHRAFSQLLDRLNLTRGVPDTTSQQLRKLSGIWVGTWDHRGTRRDAVLSIKTDSRTPEIEMRISYRKNGVPTSIVQQLRPRSDGSTWTLEGIGYEFVERGTARGWHLDTFELTLNPDESALVGKKRDTRGRKALVRFAREHVFLLDVGGGTLDTVIATVTRDFAGRVDVNALTADFRKVAEEHAELAARRPGIPVANEVQPTSENPSTRLAGVALIQLSHADILEIHSVAVSLSLENSRTALLAGIHAGITSSLPEMAEPASQLLSDLHHLNLYRPRDDISPLALWLSSAIALRRSHRATPTFERLLEILQRAEDADGA